MSSPLLPPPSLDTKRAYVVQNDDAPGFWVAGNLWRLMASGVQTGNQLCLLDQVCTDDGGGPPTHTHAQDEGLYVISGHCTFHAGGLDIDAGPGTFVSVPRLTPHAFNVDAPATQLLNFYLPAGFDMILASIAVPAEHNEPPPKDLKMPPAKLVERLSADYGQVEVLGLPFRDPPSPERMLTTPGENASLPPLANTAARAPAWWHAGGLWTLLASGEQTGGSYCIYEQLMREGTGAPPHVHTAADEMLYVLDGELRPLIDDRVETLSKGGLAFIPRGTVHGFRVERGPARLLNLYTPGGFERSIEALGEPARARELPPVEWQAPSVSASRRDAVLETVGMRALPWSEFPS